MKRKIAPLIVVAGCLGLAGVFYIYSEAHSEPKPAATAPAARPVVVAMPKQMKLAETALVTGTAEANAYVEIRPEISGRITEIHFTEGTVTEAGAPLVSLDSRAAEALRDEAKAQLDNAGQQLSRATALRSSSAIPVARIDELTAGLEIAKARLRGAEVTLDQHTIRMPFSGMVGLRRLSVGAQVDDSTILTTADDSSILNVVFQIPDVWLNAVKIGLSVQLIPAQDQNIRLTGTVVALDSRVNPSTRTIGVKAQVQNPEGLVKPGSLVKVEVPLNERPDALVVPEQSIISTGEKNALFVVREGKAVRLDVELGLRQSGMVEITKGLNAADRVIAAGSDRLREGAAVTAAQTLDGWAAP